MTTREDPAAAKLPERAEALLADWPAAPRDDASWESSATRIDETARTALAVEAGADDVLAAPLPRETDEPETSTAPAEPTIELDLDRAPARLRGAETPAPPPSSGRVSLADLARASQGQRAATPPPPSTRGADAPPKPADRSSLAERASAFGAEGAPASEKKPLEGRTEGSGAFDLAAMMAAARASGPPAPPSAQAAAPVAARSYAPEPLSKAMPSRFPLPPPVPIVHDSSSSRRGLYAIGGVAFAGLAAAVALFARHPATETAPTAAASTNAEAEPAPTTVAEALPAEPAGSVAAKAASPGAKLALATPSPAANATKTNLTAGGALVIKPGAAATETAAVPSPATPPAGDLGGAMKTAAGATGAEPAATAEQKTAAGGAAQGLPSTPSQGAVQGALGSKMSVARGCVKGMDAPSRANLVFSSDGKVKSITISGAAAGTAAEPCIKRALSSANVGPFVQATFSVGWTVRP